MTPQAIEILDLRHFTARQLRPLLTEQAAVWQRRLRWDYRPSIDLLLGYLDQRILPGYVATARGKIVGYTFCVYEEQKAVIGDVYATHALPDSLAIAHTLVRHLLETLQASPTVARIEGQLLLFDAGILTPAFPGFAIHPRLFLELDLPSRGTVSAPIFPAAVELLRWNAALYNPAAALIYSVYQGHIDSDINDQYRTLAGSLRFLHNVIRFPGCGTFDPDASWALRSRHTNQLAAILLVSRVASDTAHITQLCVDPALHGQALGRNLLALCLNHLPSRNYKALTLTVTEANTPAVHLYARAGFRTRLRFEALVATRPFSS